jgi:DNA-binding GntR family transcriptional regulator
VLREQIMLGQIRPGDRLRQVEIAAELELSTTPVREAFRSLATEGLVQIDEHRGVVVRKLTLEECIEMQELIAIVEPDNLRHAVPRMDAATLAEADAICRKMNRADVGNRYALLNRELHLTLARASGRQRAIALLAELLTLNALHVPSDSTRLPGRRAQAQREHRALVEAVRAGDAEEAARVVYEHCQPILTLLRGDLARNGNG